MLPKVCIHGNKEKYLDNKTLINVALVEMDLKEENFPIKGWKKIILLLQITMIMIIISTSTYICFFFLWTSLSITNILYIKGAFPWNNYAFV